VNQSSSATENRKIHIGPITQGVAVVGCATGDHNPFFYDVDAASSSCTTSSPTVCRSRSLCHELRLQVFNESLFISSPARSRTVSNSNTNNNTTLIYSGCYRPTDKQSANIGSFFFIYESENLTEIFNVSHTLMTHRATLHFTMRSYIFGDLMSYHM
jgi:hypothetical protein